MPTETTPARILGCEETPQGQLSGLPTHAYLNINWYGIPKGILGVSLTEKDGIILTPDDKPFNGIVITTLHHNGLPALCHWYDHEHPERSRHVRGVSFEYNLYDDGSIRTEVATERYIDGQTYAHEQHFTLTGEKDGYKGYEDEGQKEYRMRQNKLQEQLRPFMPRIHPSSGSFSTTHD